MLQEKEFVELIDQHQGIIHKICRVYLDDPADHEDLFQEITLQAWKSLKSFKGESRFSTWLYRVALNTAITFYKKTKKNRHTIFADHLPNTVEEYDPIEEQVQAMYRAIAGLSKIDKALVMLYLDNHSYKEMAEVLGITVSNVGAKMNRIKSRLRDEAKKHFQPLNG